MFRPGIEDGPPHNHSTQLVNKYSEHLHMSARPVENALDITLFSAILACKIFGTLINDFDVVSVRYYADNSRCQLQSRVVNQRLVLEGVLKVNQPRVHSFGPNQLI
jgi:hypothetical protein